MIYISSKVMNLSENYNKAVKKYGEEIVKEVLKADIPYKYVLSACRFHCEPPYKPALDILSVKFRDWETYVLPDTDKDANTITLDEFNKLIHDGIIKSSYPNPIYDDVQVAIGIFKSKSDAEKCTTIQGYNSDFSICGDRDYESWTKDGYKILSIYDKRVRYEDPYRCVFGLVKDGDVHFYAHDFYAVDIDSFSTGREESKKYFHGLPYAAQSILLDYVWKTKS